MADRSYVMNDFKIKIEQFLKSLEGTNEVSETYYINIERFFNNQIYPYYEKTGKRIEDFTLDDMVDFMSESKIALKIRSFENNCVFIRKYMRWCEQEGYISSDKLNSHFSFIPNVMSTIFNEGKYAQIVTSRKYFTSTKEYVEFINIVFGEELSEQVDFIRDISRFDNQKAIMYLLWLGFPAEKIISLNKDDFDVKAKTISGIEIEDKNIYSFFCEYKPKTGFLRLRKKGEEYYADYSDTSHFIKGVYNEPNLITVRNAVATVKKRQGFLPDNHKFKNITVNASTIFYSQLFEKCHKAEIALVDSPINLSVKTIESCIKDVIRDNVGNANDSSISKAFKEYKLYKAILNLNK